MGIKLGLDGKFITFEGGEGAGKSTQIQILADTLRDKGLSVVVTREPGGSDGAEAIRTLLVEGGTDRWTPMSEVLLNFAARRDHLSRLIQPALSRGDWVLCDRFADSTVAYQGYGQGLGVKSVLDIWELAINGFRPDKTLIFDMPVDVGLERAMKRGGLEDRYERMGHEFHEKLRQGFLDIARKNADRCQLIDATGSIDQVSADIRDAVLPLITS